MLKSARNESGDSLYKKLYASLRADIESKVYAPGQRLPSKRTLAKTVGVSVITVESAYAQLIAEGYVRTMEKRGYYVCELPDEMHHHGKVSNVEEASEDSIEAPRIDLTTNDADIRSFPYSVCMKNMKNVLRDRKDDVMRRSPCVGTLELRRAISDHLRTFRGISAPAERIVVGAGSELLYGMLALILGDRTFGVEDPGRLEVAHSYRLHGKRVRLVAMDDRGVRPDMIGDADVLHISPSHHFPTGGVMPVARRYELLSWASEEEGRYLIEDDYDSEFRLIGMPIPAMESIDVAGRVIYINTFTETFTPTVRISYMVLPPALMELYTSKLGLYSCTISTFEQIAHATLLEQGFFEKHIMRMRGIFIRKRNALLRAMRGAGLKNVASISGEDSGLHFVLKFCDRVDGDETAERLRARGVAIRRVADYASCPTDDDRRSFVVCYSSLSEDDIAHVASEIAGCVAMR